MTPDNRIESFVTLGEFLKQFSNEQSKPVSNALNDRFYTDFEELIIRVHIHNPWFTESNVRTAITALADSLDREQLQAWLAPYRDELNKQKKINRVAVIMAGNVPLVGFHDFLCVLLSGNRF